MATVLLTWELGGGLGHLVNLLPLAKGLAGRGHRVCAALKDLSSAHRVLGEVRLSYLQAPVATSQPDKTDKPPRTFAQILHARGFADANELRTLAAAWRNLYDLVRPDLIVFDHSPTALLAARGLPVKRALIGTGFFCPPDEYPMRDLRPWLPGNSQELKKDEDLTLANANEVLSAWGQVPLGRLSQLYHDVDENFLATFPELDHYAGRCGSLAAGPSSASRPGENRYWGAWPNVGGKKPVWPEGRGKRVFAYLKPFQALPRLLQQLYDLRCPTLVYADRIDGRLIARFQSPALRIETEPLDLQETGRSCDLAILNGNHGTTVAMLLAGKPTLQVPIALEQGLFSMAVERLGATIVAPANRPQQVVAGLMELLGSTSHAEAARAFAARYAGFEPQRQIAAMVQRAEELMQYSPGTNVIHS